MAFAWQIVADLQVMFADMRPDGLHGLVDEGAALPMLRVHAASRAARYWVGATP
jgi:hypothetical protein